MEKTTQKYHCYARFTPLGAIRVAACDVEAESPVQAAELAAAKTRHSGLWTVVTGTATEVTVTHTTEYHGTIKASHHEQEKS